MDHRALAVSCILGVRRCSPIAPGMSVLNSCPPPIPSKGITAIASTIKPIPPIHCRSWR